MKYESRGISLVVTVLALSLSVQCTRPLLKSQFTGLATGATPVAVSGSLDQRPASHTELTLDGKTFTVDSYYAVVGMNKVTAYSVGGGAPGGPQAQTRTVNRVVTEKYVILYRQGRLLWHGPLHIVHRADDSVVREVARAVWGDRPEVKRCPRGGEGEWPVYSILER